ncbi:MAG: TatD family hydrolase [Clostridia bacterium]|nr:TatD family hydrolase [Clostridia bacterium]
MRYIDVHCHINQEDYGSVDKLIENIKAAGVEKIISAGFDLPSSEYGKELSEKYEGVYFTAGFHPTELKGYSEHLLERIEELALNKKCVAIGEIGLDYHYPDTNKELQYKAFRAQLELADRLKLPVQIHSRDCAEDMLGILKEYAPFKYGALLHCYSHSTELSKEFEKLGIYFSFGGTSTWSGSKKAKRTISALPLNIILTETDSPYLPPKSKYGTFPNTPESIPEIAQNIAEIKGKTCEEVTSQVWSNAHTLFTKLNN